MRVRDVIGIKGASIVSVRGDQPLSHAVAEMARHNIGSVLVVDAQGGPQGIVSEPDIVAIVVSRGAQCLGEPVDRAIRTPLPRCAPDQPIGEALKQMTRERVRYLLVAESDTPFGLVSIGDLVKARLESTELESRVLRDMARVKLLAAT